jgi:hypothetical protein
MQIALAARVAKGSFCGLSDVSLNAGLWVISISAWFANLN